MKNKNLRTDKLFCLTTAFFFVVFAYLASQGVAVIRPNVTPNWFFLGLLLSVHGGAIFTFLLNLILEWYEPGLKKENQEKKNKKKKNPNVPSCLTGFIERFIFTTIIGIIGTDSLSYVGALMGGWLALKVAVNWQRIQGGYGRARGIMALLNGLVSLCFALIGGLVTDLK